MLPNFLPVLAGRRHELLLPDLAEAGDPVERAGGHPLRPPLSVERVGEPVCLVEDLRPFGAGFHAHADRVQIQLALATFQLVGDVGARLRHGAGALSHRVLRQLGGQRQAHGSLHLARAKRALLVRARQAGRLDGKAVGVMINDPAVMAGSLTSAAARKMERFVDTCDTFHLPMVNLVDQPGVMIGLEAERAGTLLAAAKASAAIEQASIPWVSVVMRRAFGIGGGMLGPWQGPQGTSLNHRFAWPTARWGSIPIEGGVAAAHKREIEAAPDPTARREELEAYYQRLASPFRTAEAFGVVDIIKPSETRRRLCTWADDAYRLIRTNVGPRARTMR